MSTPQGKLPVNTGLDGHRQHQSCSVIAPSACPLKSMVGTFHYCIHVFAA